MPTYQLQINTTQDHAEQCEALLFGIGSLSVSFTDSEDQPIFEPEPGTTPLWQNITILALFEQKPDIEQIFQHFSQNGVAIKKTALSVEPLPDKDWQRAWMEDYQPMQYGDKLWVVPHHLNPPDSKAINLRLDPGLAFGSGTHATTRLCLEWIAQNNMDNKTLVDFGCGSGILAIAACLCGARQATCTDIDPQALQATQNNAKNNHVSTKISLFLPEELPNNLQADIVLANILSGPLCQLAENISALCKPQGTLVLSGILADQADQVIHCYQKYFSHFQQHQLDGWVRIIANN